MFGYPEVHHGITPYGAVPTMLNMMKSKGDASLLLTGRKISAAEALPRHSHPRRTRRSVTGELDVPALVPGVAGALPRPSRLDQMPRRVAAHPHLVRPDRLGLHLVSSVLRKINSSPTQVARLETFCRPVSTLLSFWGRVPICLSLHLCMLMPRTPIGVWPWRRARGKFKPRSRRVPRSRVIPTPFTLGWCYLSDYYAPAAEAILDELRAALPRRGLGRHDRCRRGRERRRIHRRAGPGTDGRAAAARVVSTVLGPAAAACRIVRVRGPYRAGPCRRQHARLAGVAARAERAHGHRLSVRRTVVGAQPRGTHGGWRIHRRFVRGGLRPGSRR